MQVPCDPKMLVAVLQPDKLSQFNITTLEQDMRQDLILESGVGIPLSLLDTQRYAVPDIAHPLAPEDAALVMVCLHGRVAVLICMLTVWEGACVTAYMMDVGVAGPDNRRGTGGYKEKGEIAWRGNGTVLAHADHLHCQ